MSYRSIPHIGNRATSSKTIKKNKAEEKPKITQVKLYNRRDLSNRPIEGKCKGSIKLMLHCVFAFEKNDL